MCICFVQRVYGIVACMEKKNKQKKSNTYIYDGNGILVSGQRNQKALN